MKVDPAVKAKIKSLTPKLRFPEFKDGAGWQEELLGAQTEFYKGRGISKADVDPSGNRLCIRYGELYTRYGEVIEEIFSRTSAPDAALFLSRRNDVILPASGETKEDIATASCVMIDGVALGSDLNVLRTPHDGVFLSYLLNGTKRQDIAKVAQGDSVVHLYPSQLAQISIAFPEITEQRRISACLKSLDKWIAAEGRRLEALRMHKNGLTQKLFPRFGELSPDLRLPEFRSRPRWQSKRVGSILERAVFPIKVEADKTYREIGVRSHGKGVFHKDAIKGAAIGTKRVFRVVEDALVLNIIFAWEQAVAFTTKAEAGMIASHRFPMFLPKSRASDVRFLQLAFLTQTGRHLLGLASPGGAGRNRTLGQNEFDKLEIAVPEWDEQTRIADVFLAAGALIGAQSRKLDVLRSHRRGLLQQLFPALERL